MPINRTAHNWKEGKGMGFIITMLRDKRRKYSKDGSGWGGWRRVCGCATTVWKKINEKQTPSFVVIPICMIKICFTEQTLE